MCHSVFENYSSLPDQGKGSGPISQDAVLLDLGVEQVQGCQAIQHNVIFFNVSVSKILRRFSLQDSQDSHSKIQCFSSISSISIED